MKLPCLTPGASGGGSTGEHVGEHTNELKRTMETHYPKKVTRSNYQHPKVLWLNQNKASGPGPETESSSPVSRKHTE